MPHARAPSRAEWMWLSFAVSEIDSVLLLLVTDVVMNAVDDWQRMELMNAAAASLPLPTGISRRLFLSQSYPVPELSSTAALQFGVPVSVPARTGE